MLTHRDSSIFALAAFAVVFAASPARAGGASPWSEDTRSAIRLIADATKDRSLLRAGVEIKMARGWHTYWRYPGDAGVPPQFDFSGSENVAEVSVLWPAPRALVTESGISIGYESNVIFPLKVRPRDEARSVKLSLKMQYAVCEKLCIPAQGTAALTLGTGGPTQDAALRQAEAQVPQPASPEDIGLTVQRGGDAAKPEVIVELAAAASDIALFVEGPTPEWALPIPRPAPAESASRKRFKFGLDGLPPGTDPKAAHVLTFTVVASGGAREVRARLD